MLPNDAVKLSLKQPLPFMVF